MASAVASSSSDQDRAGEAKRRANWHAVSGSAPEEERELRVGHHGEEESSRYSIRPPRRPRRR